MMKIALIGSADHLDDDDERKTYKEACGAIARTIAIRGHQLVVGSDQKLTADLYAVDAINAIKDTPNLSAEGKTIWVFHSDARVHGRPFDEKTYDGLNLRRRIRPGSASTIRAFQLNEAHAAIALGGGHGTLQIGMSSPALERPVLALRAFRGAADQIWANLRTDYTRAGLTDDQINELGGDWNNESAGLAVDMVETLRRRNPYKLGWFKKLLLWAESVFTTILAVLAFVAIVALISAWLYIFFVDRDIFDKERNITAFVLLGISTLLGTSLRELLTFLQLGRAIVSMRRFMFDITGAVLLAFGFAIVYYFTSFTSTGTVASLVDDKDFFRVGLIVSLLGFFVALAFEVAAQRMRETASRFITQEK